MTRPPLSSFTATTSRPALDSFAAPTAQQPLSENIWKDLAIGVVKGAGSTIKSVGDMAAANAPTLAGPLLSSIPAVKNKINSVVNPVKDAIQGSVGLTDENLKATNTPQAVGKGIETAAELFTGAGTANAARKAATFSGDLIKTVAPKLTPTEIKEAAKLGLATVSKLTGKVSLDFSKDPSVVKAADAVKDYVKVGAPAATNINRVKDGITTFAENTVKPLLAENPTPFHFDQLRDSLKLVTPDESLKAEPLAFQTYERVRERILQTVYNVLKKSGERGNITDHNQLWDARKVIDSVIENELGSKTFGTPQYTGVKAAAKDIRNGLSRFITDNIANPGQMDKINQLKEFIQVARSKGIEITEEMLPALKQQMGITDIPEAQALAKEFEAHIGKLNGMYTALENLASHIPQEVGKTRIGRFLKAHPRVKDAVKIGAGATAGALGIKLLND